MYEFEVLLKNGERTFIWGYGQFFVSIGDLHNFPYAFLVNLTKEIFPKSLDFLCGLWYTCIIKREERNT